MSQAVSMRRLARPIAALAALALGVLALVPVVVAASPAPASPVPASGSFVPASSVAAAVVAPSGLEGAPLRLGLLRATVRADLTVVRRDGSTVLVHYEVGRITAVSATSISVTGRDGKGATFAVSSTTRVRRDGHPISISALRVGDRALIFGTAADGSYTAFLIRSPKAAGAAG